MTKPSCHYKSIPAYEKVFFIFIDNASQILDRCVGLEAA
jgi:hypothetical protein